MVRLFTLLTLLPLALAIKAPQNTTTSLVVEDSSSSSQSERMAAPPGVISAPDAKALLEIAVKKATDIKSPSNIAVVDSYGHLVAFVRMDGAVLASIDVAQKKARTVAMFGGRFRSGDLFNATGPGGPLFGIQNTNSGLIFFGGGVPLKRGDTVLGAIGVSGGTTAQDVEIADAAAESLKKA